MSRRAAVIVVSLVLLALAGTWFWFRQRHVPAEIPIAVPSNANQSPEVESPTESNMVKSQPPLAGELQRLVQRKGSQENGPVAFFGKIVDQDGQPAAGVRIEARCGYYLTTEFSGNAAVRDVREQKTFTVESDMAGMFSVSGFHASWVELSGFQKEGYVLGENQAGGFPFAPRLKELIPKTSPEEPHLFRMWRRGATEPLITIERRITVSKPGVPQYINLITGAISDTPGPDSDLEVNFHWRGEPLHALVPWVINLSAVNGGLLETNAVFLFRAPSDGYVERITYDWDSPQVQEWYRASRAQRYFIKSRGGRLFSALIAEFYVFPREGVRLRYRFWGNPTGSRNLEPDPEKQITDPEEIRRLDEGTRK